MPQQDIWIRDLQQLYLVGGDEIESPTFGGQNNECIDPMSCTQFWGVYLKYMYLKYVFQITCIGYMFFVFVFKIQCPRSILYLHFKYNFTVFLF